jgi:hypothetical protein
MEFKIRYGSYFLLRISMVIIRGGLGLLDFLSPLSNNGYLHYKWIVETVLSFLWFLQICRLFYLSLLKRSILTVNENYIGDFNYKIKYFWKDIKEIYEKRDHLFINLYHQEDYLDKIGNPVRRFVAKL